MVLSIDLSCVRSTGQHIPLGIFFSLGQHIPPGFSFRFSCNAWPFACMSPLGRCRSCHASCPEGFRPRPLPLGEQGLCELCGPLRRVGTSLRSLDRVCAAYDHLLGLLLLAESYALLVTTGPESDRFILDPVSPEPFIAPMSSHPEPARSVSPEPTSLFRRTGHQLDVIQK